ncbi:glycosyltransferase family 9 protein [Erwinia psidii]|uniref:Lipopolysaccharide heptosyltransferase family protein n=1 Tax=Erwinia psidii TaxID=69224 RepID=A0A3N6SEY3_9GAMM|nr:glycosyltransferase family 9 protein [Erwinia psidii]MCX8959151.1 lipopolysaccharide heptosyltransferase family protein [Erwinia psidii]MCX8966869.1 lipopolysaccharide heptosyltransferase family protein [Erwinia psidii]RQM37211.1 lipopolysaccharide heptosyltransferase family protein [Erwinia psidii]
MNYVLLFLLLLPVKLLKKLGKKKSSRNLVIQTAKIGDFINITPLLKHLKHSDALLSRSVAPLARHDATLEEIFYIEDYKGSMFNKLKLAFALINRYDSIYLLHPDSLNLFCAAMCNASDKQFISTYRRKWYHALFYATANGIVEHSRTSLTLESYLRLAERTLDRNSYPKHATFPLYQPQNPPEELYRSDMIKIGISISAGNQAKTIPAAIWKTLFERLSSLPCLFYVFGTASESPWLQQLYNVLDDSHNIVNMIGKIPLEELPYAIGKMDFYIASDSGNVYIADSQNVPVILIYGPCSIEEQRPLGEVLLIGPDHIAPSSFIFQAPYKFVYPAEKLFALDTRKLDDIYDFIHARSTPLLTVKKI